MSRTPIRSTVVAPVPWFPFRGRLFGRFGDFASVATREQRFGVDIIHNRYPVIPRFGMNQAPKLMFRASRKVVRECVAAKQVALIDAHYFYPDGVAASHLAMELKLPYVITARGSDINLIARYSSPRKQMLQAARNASALISVSEALAKQMRQLGMPSNKIHVLRNGVDLDFFRPADGAEVRDERSPGGPMFLSVGALKNAKGHDVAIKFIKRIPQARLVIAGRGTEESALRRLAKQLGICERVKFAGTLDPESLRARYRAAAALILMSKREGMPNVVLESLACGTPVLATPVGGVTELITRPCCGELVRDRSADGLMNAWEELSRRGTSSGRIREYALRFSWAETIDGLHRLIEDKAMK